MADQRGNLARSEQRTVLTDHGQLRAGRDDGAIPQPSHGTTRCGTDGEHRDTAAQPGVVSAENAS